ncbi:helix-turn-helix domain-containing protein [Caldivirga sp.]|uniref:helix-turn-helix domain-containing protein n=1 Tax=Caldivirga sp. TaxID=2080243 RepID=UPI0025BEDF18|nr:helix-turn-helix domain-containing protein [Caldivirga sp.]
MWLFTKRSEYNYIEFDYEHLTDWTIKTSDIDHTFNVFNTYVDASRDYVLEFAVLKVWSKADLRRIMNIISRHRNIKAILGIKPLNYGYPKNIQIVLKGDAGDSTRYMAHVLGGIEVKAIYENGIEHWGFIFPSKSSTSAFIDMISRNGNVNHVNVDKININDLMPAVMSKALLLLSPRELRIMRHAYRRGFFEIPRRIKLDELAKELGLSKATLDEYIRNSLNKIIRTLFNIEDNNS